MRKHTFSRKRTRSTSRGLAGLGLPMIPGLRPHRAPVNPELARQHGHADPLRAGCSHSVHFAVCESCSRSFLWFRRRTDQRIVGVAVGPGTSTCALIPRGNKPLDPWSPVPAALHCFHRRIDVQTADIGGLRSRVRSAALAAECFALDLGVEERAPALRAGSRACVCVPPRGRARSGLLMR